VEAIPEDESEKTLFIYGVDYDKIDEDGNIYKDNNIIGTKVVSGGCFYENGDPIYNYIPATELTYLNDEEQVQINDSGSTVVYNHKDYDWTPQTFGGALDGYNAIQVYRAFGTADNYYKLRSGDYVEKVTDNPEGLEYYENVYLCDKLYLDGSYMFIPQVNNQNV